MERMNMRQLNMMNTFNHIDNISTSSVYFQSVKPKMDMLGIHSLDTFYYLRWGVTLYRI